MGYLNIVGVGDSLQYLKQIPDNSIDSVVTDAPYGLGETPDLVAVLSAWMRGEVYEPTGKGFMGKKWDAFVPQPPIWRECLRVLKPGGHLLCFFGTRTYDLGTLAIRFAGFDVIDQLAWVYGSGFPKSIDLGNSTKDPRWKGWQSSLKPAYEPIVLARKPFDGTLTKNISEHGTGGLNVGACRIAHDEECRPMKRQHEEGEGDAFFGQAGRHKDTTELKPEGRWPANLLLDEEAGKLLDEQSGHSKSASGEQKIVRKTAGATLWHGMGREGNEHIFQGHGDEGGASRFFYCAKAKQSRRWAYCKKCDVVFTANSTEAKAHQDHWDQVVKHPTQKPLELMEWLIRLVTQPGGVVLDPYCGTGTTALAAQRQGFNFVTCDLSPSYAAIARVRLSADGSESRDQLASGAHLCPGCKAAGKVTLIDKDTIDTARERGRKVTCMKCLQRFPASTFSGE